MTLRRQENIVYAIIWGIAFLVPLARLVVNDPGPGSAWDNILNSWLTLLPLLLLFFLHNFLVAPLLVEKGRKKTWLALTALLVALFCGYVFMTRSSEGPFRGGPGEPPKMEMRGPAPMAPPEGEFRDGEGPGPRNGGPAMEKHGKAPMKPLAPEMVKILMALLVIGVNLSIKLFFKGIQNERDLEELEQEKLSSQLQYLRYQISPHFFMNTLNNIHALVDIDPEKAKDSIVQLSKLMRYMLYEGNKPTIPVDKEISFLKQYVSLMRLRYDDSVKISLSVPEEAAGAEIPPLLFITFVENAFKHGISYRNESFVDISMTAGDGRLRLRCRNSRHGEPREEDKGGIGVGNTRRRLDLLYGNDYTMDVTDDGEVYVIDLDIPSIPEIYKLK